jgi:hypothetical protein
MDSQVNIAHCFNDIFFGVKKGAQVFDFEKGGGTHFISKETGEPPGTGSEGLLSQDALACKSCYPFGACVMSSSLAFMPYKGKNFGRNITCA